jgi:hypothetical protein
LSSIRSSTSWSATRAAARVSLSAANLLRQRGNLAFEPGNAPAVNWTVANGEFSHAAQQSLHRVVAAQVLADCRYW